MTAFEPTDRMYTSWNPELTNLNPIEEKLLLGDTINSTNSIIKNSPYRCNTIPGILVFDGRTFGRNSNGKTLYKCVPNDIKLPIFLVPYTQKKTSFSKNKVNKYILFKFDSWNSSQKHPCGVITNTLGNVDDFGVYCEYQLYCRNIQVSIQKFHKIVNEKIFGFKNPDNLIDTIHATYDIEERLDMNIIAIDPEGSSDYDDALGIIEMANGDYILSIYITNVVIVFEVLGLWNELTDRITSIYLPDKKRSMLPAGLSESLCSLVTDSKSIAFAMDITLDTDYQIKSIEFHNCVISVKNNYTYESDILYTDPLYQELKKCSSRMLDKYPYLDCIEDSHDVVAYFMILMNHQCGKQLALQNTGIFRNATLTSNTVTKDVPNDIKKFVKYYKQTGGSYCTYSGNKGHDMIGKGVDYYSQVTSPIRRIVDLINMTILQDTHKMIKISKECQSFVTKWIENIDTINSFTKNVKKVQNDCNLLYRSIQQSSEKELVDGYIIERLNDTKYLVYIPALSMKSTFISSTTFHTFEKQSFTIYTFMDEATLQRKVQLQIFMDD